MAAWKASYDVREEVRLAKSALLYADTVVLAAAKVAVAMGPSIRKGATDAVGALQVAAEQCRDFVDLMTLPSGPAYGYRERSDLLAVASAFDDLAAAGAADALTLPPIDDESPRRGAEFVTYHGMFAIVDPYTIPFADASDPDVRKRFAPEVLEDAAQAVERRRDELDGRTAQARPQATVEDDRDGAAGRRRLAEGLLAAGLLGSLPAFPDVPMDVVLDAREQLRDARTSFRSAMVTGARELDEGVQADEHPLAIVAELRRRDVEPALAQLDNELRDLGVLSFLSRSVDAGVTATASISIGAGGVLGTLGELGAGLAGALATPAILAAAVKELEHQRRRRRELAATPYWLLHQADRLAQKRLA